MKFFVEAGVNPTTKDKISQTPLYYTAREGKYLCSLFLLDCGCQLNEKDLYQQTPIYYAARYLDFNHIERADLMFVSYL
jgi:ankyrin repeat protein